MMAPSSKRIEWPCRFWWILSLSLSLLISTPSAIVAAEANDDECPLWLALSHTSTDKKPIYGLFAGRTYQANESLPNSELAIPLVDMIEPYNRDTRLHDAIIEFIENHLWTGDHAGSQWEGNRSSPVAIPGIGVLAQYHTGISNVDFTQASVLLREHQDITVAGKPHPSRGAISPYYNVTLHATQIIPAGMELFADFGDVWDGNYTDDTYQDKIHRYDYEHADLVIDALVDFYKDANIDDNFDLQQDIMDFILHKVLGTVSGKHAKTIRSLIPENPKKLKVVQQAGGSFLYRYSDMIRTPQWLRKNGICLNTIKGGVSTVSSAGRGAFAARSVKQGETIAITPMLHIADKELLTMYPLETDEDGDVDYNREAKSIGKQLLMNYCFGHPESSMLLFPLGSMITLINHQQEANAYITWSKASDSLSNQHQYHDMTVNEMAKVDKVVLVMKIVAHRDIAPDEEIFLNYGPDWDKAWKDYNIKWEMGKEPKAHPIKAEDVRVSYKNQPLETRTTLMYTRYPPNVATACFLKTQERPDGFPMIDPETGLDINEWFGPAAFEDYKGKRLYVVDVLDRVEAPGFFYNYTIVARITADHIERVENVPHAACTFVNAAYTSDIHVPGAFRHPIGIMDGHWPQAWRDLRDL